MNFNIKFLTALVLFLIASGSLIEKRQQVFRNRSFYVVKTDSMGSALRKGSVAVVERGSVNPIIGDVVTFKSPLNIGELITHRVVAFDEEISGGLITKGDNNITPDPWILTSEMFVGTVELSIPLFGYLVWFIQSPFGLILLVILPGIYIAFTEFNNLLEQSWDGFFNNRKLIYRIKKRIR